MLPALVIWLSSGTARADDAGAPTEVADAKARAEAKVAEARGSYERGDFQASLATLEQAYALYPSPKLFFNFGVVQRALGRDVEALASFERFLREGGAGIPPERRVEAEQHVADLKARVAVTDVTSDVAGAEPVDTPDVTGFPVKGEVPAKLPAASPAGTSRLRRVAWGMGAMGVLGLAAGGYLSWRVSAIQAELRRNAANPEGQFPQDFNGKASAGRRLARWQYPAYVAGGALLAGGITCYLMALSRDRAARDGSLMAMPMVSSGFAAVQIRGRF